MFPPTSTFALLLRQLNGAFVIPSETFGLQTASAFAL